jgi:predicted adenylyl cyclase CyaB
MHHTNIEVKAKCDNQERIRKLLFSLKADFKGVDYQTDTYFNVNNGRLKLREGNIENNLIYYNRQNTLTPKQSDVMLMKTEPNSAIKVILQQALEVFVEVKKQREIYFIDNVKFHLDTIDSLGTFVEIEAIDLNNKIGKEYLMKQCQHYINLFGISENDFISVSYSDMLFEIQKNYVSIKNQRRLK